MGTRRHQLPAGRADRVRQHAGDGRKLADQEAREGLLHPVPAAGNGHARRVPGARLLPVLRVLGSDAAADVLPDRHLGRPAEGIRGDQVLPVHAGRQRADADRHPDAVLQQRPAASCRPSSWWPPASSARSSTKRPASRAAKRSARPRRRSTRSTSWPCSRWASTPICSTTPDPGGASRSQWWAFVLLFIGFAIKVPSVPFHTWLPDAHVEAPTPISMILAGVLLKMGGYGIIRICYPICPDGGLRPGVRRLRHRRREHGLRRVRRAGPDRLQAAGRLQLGEPHGLRRARPRRVERGRPATTTTPTTGRWA